MSERDSRERGGLFEEAASWFARMRGPDADASREEFERWLARGALHRAAYNRAAEIFAMGKVLAEDPPAGAPTPRMLRRDRRLVAGAIAAATVMLLALSWVAFGMNARLPRGENLIAGSASETNSQVAELTASSEMQSIRLADGSIVRLEPGARLAVQYAQKVRRLSLERGNARFYVAHEVRPFVVFAGGGYVVAHGTVFDVGVSSNRHVTVRLIEGVVDVKAPPRQNDTPRRPSAHRLRAGETISFAAAPDALASSTEERTEAGSAHVLSDADYRSKDFDSITLGELVRLANQGSSRPIRLGDLKSEQLRISGKFRIDDTDLLAERIADLFNMTVDRSNPREILLTGK